SEMFHDAAAGNRRAPVVAAALLGVMALLMFTSSWNDTPTSDDNVALISGYSYLRRQEFRLEPQNPPLMEDLAAAPLLWMNLREPWDHKAWEEANDPELGQAFLYQMGNDPDAMLRAARTPMILFALLFGAALFGWTRKEFGSGAALLTLFLYVFSPTFLAHGRIVATDLGATAGFFLTIAAFLRFLKRPRWSNGLLAGLVLGLALLSKFSTIALLPILLFLAAAWAFANATPGRRIRWRRLPGGGFALALRRRRERDNVSLLGWLARAAGIIVIAFLVVYAVYLHHIWNYAPERQARDAQFQRTLYDLGGTAADMVLWSSDRPLLRPWSQYFLGLLVALKASRWGQPVFFLGSVRPTGSRWYFPFVYLIKEPLPLHLLTLLALAWALRRGLRIPLPPAAASNRLQPLRQWLREHFVEFAFLSVLGVYWAALIRSNMNIGVRHLLPAFPFLFILIARPIVSLAQTGAGTPRRRWGFRALLGALLAWQAIGVLRVHPSYLAYFNELVGGPRNGWRYVNDSNLDWGQDVKRLAQFVEQRAIAGIRVDYFGPADAGYYLKERYLGPLGCTESPKGWVAVSAMLYPGAPWNPGCDYRARLPMEKLVATIGYSIFVFYVD
ncbi:MAG TPA: glycosyltransferase family 39 protein, partial [Terriglobia bacterium]|nr:glycosyltransferase family 39 protein [Terriglobia bacterium]